MRLTIAILVAYNCLYASAWAPSIPSTRVLRRNGLSMQVEGGSEDELGTSGNRGVRVPIESIPGLFNDGIFVPTAGGDNNDGEAVYYDDEDDEDEGRASSAPEVAPPSLQGNSKVTSKQMIIPPPPPPLPNTEPEPVFQRPKEPSSSFDMMELVAMESQAKLEGSGQGEEADKESTIPSTKRPTQQAQDVGEEQESVDSSEDSYDLSRALDSQQAAEVRRSLSIISPTAVRSGEQVRRITKYDPKDRYRPDPMKYGAYRRWQVEGDEESDSRKSSKGGRSSSDGKGRRGRGGRGTDDSSSSRGRVSSDKQRGKDKKKGDTGAFYKAIKKLGSGPKSDGEATGTGVADPSKGMKNADLGKPVPRGRRTKRVVTAEDIDSIFTEQGGGSERDSDGSGDGFAVAFDDDDDGSKRDTEDLTVPQQEGPVDSTKVFDRLGASAFDSQEAGAGDDAAISMDSLAAEETPKWLVDATRDAKKALRTKGKKKKKLTDDWRFWIGIVAAIGFGSAAVQMSGTQTNINEVMPMNMQREPSAGQRNPYGIGQRNEPDELVI